MRLRRIYSALCVCAGLLAARGAAAEPLRLHGVAAAAHAITGYQKDEFGWGPAGQVALELPFGKVFGLELQLDTLWLSQGSAPSDPRFERGGSATASGAALGVRVRPFGEGYRGQSPAAAGLWLAASGGATLTNGLTRGMFDAQLGFDFVIPEGVSEVQAYRQFGNSVIVPQFAWVAGEIAKQALDVFSSRQDHELVA